MKRYTTILAKAWDDESEGANFDTLEDAVADAMHETQDVVVVEAVRVVRFSPTVNTPVWATAAPQPADAPYRVGEPIEYASGENWHSGYIRGIGLNNYQIERQNGDKIWRVPSGIRRPSATVAAPKFVFGQRVKFRGFDDGYLEGVFSRYNRSDDDCEILRPGMAVTSTVSVKDVLPL